MPEQAPECDPEIARHLPRGPGLGSLRLAELPGLSAERVSVAEGALRAGVERSEIFLADGLRLRVHRRMGRPAGVACVLSMHGGSFIVGGPEMDDDLLQRWCLRFGCVVVSVGYRLAPETPYPGPLEDCHAALLWAVEHAAELGIDPARVGVAGRSAGANLAAALAILARDRDGPAVAFQLLDAPCLDDRQSFPSAGWDVPVADPATIRLGWRAYLGDLYGTDRISATAAPHRLGSPAGLPPAFVTVGAADGLVDECRAYARRLGATLIVYPGAPHMFADFAPRATASRQLRIDQERWLGRYL